MVIIFITKTRMMSMLIKIPSSHPLCWFLWISEEGILWWRSR